MAKPNVPFFPSPEMELLADLAAVTDSHGGGGHKLREIANLSARMIGPNGIENAEKALLSNHYIRVVFTTEYDEKIVRITPEGRRALDEQGLKSKIDLSSLRKPTVEDVSAPLIRRINASQVDTKRYQRQRVVLLGAIEISSNVYGPGSVNVAKAIEEYDLEHDVLWSDEDGELWLDNDGENDLSRCLNDLESLGFIDLEIRDGANWRDRIFASVTRLGAAYYAEFTGDYYSNQDATVGLVPVPAADRVVSISHNSPAYVAAKEKLDSAVEAIRGFNGPTSYDKGQVIGELEAAKILLKSTKIRVGAIATTVLTPLLSVYNDIAAEALKPIVLDAINAIKALLGY